MGMVRFHRGDHGVHGPTLERMDGGCLGMVYMAQLGIAPAHVEHPPVLQPERRHVVFHAGNLGGLAVDETETLVVPGPANTVALAKLDRVGPINLDTARFRSEATGLPGRGPAVLSGEIHDPIAVVDYWQADDAFFDLLRNKAAVNAMLRHIGGKAVDDANLTATTKVQKKIVRDFITGDGRKKAEGWLPRYMEFPFKAYTKVGGGRLTENAARIKSLVS